MYSVCMCRQDDRAHPFQKIKLLIPHTHAFLYINLKYLTSVVVFQSEIICPKSVKFMFTFFL
jgi:hypothetical protein